MTEKVEVESLENLLTYMDRDAGLAKTHWLVFSSFMHKTVWKNLVNI